MPGMRIVPSRRSEPRDRDLHEHGHSAGEESVNVSRASWEILTRLAQAQRPDGGWGAVPGTSSNTEATALAVLAGAVQGPKGRLRNVRELTRRERHG